MTASDNPIRGCTSSGGCGRGPGGGFGLPPPGPISHSHFYRATQEGKDGKTRHVFTNTHNHPGKALTPNAVAAWFKDYFGRRLGWEGYSSHSGRRTFATTIAQKIVTAGGSLKDVQELMGHESLQTTQRYIEANANAQRKVVDL